MRLEHSPALAASACVGSCSRTGTRGGKQSRGSCAVHRIRAVPYSLTSLCARYPGQRLFGKLSADPRQCPTLSGQPLIPRARHRRGRVPEPSGLCSFAFVLPWPLLRRGRGRAGRSRQWLEARRGRAAARAVSLRLGRAGSGRSSERRGAERGRGTAATDRR